MLIKLGFKSNTEIDERPYMSELTKGLVAGGLGGAAGSAAVYPLDTMATRAQNNKTWSGVDKPIVENATKSTTTSTKKAPKILKDIESKAKSIGSSKTLRNIKGLYKGLPFKIMKGMPGSAITLGAYGLVKSVLDKTFTSEK
ncbi:hypothetical protein H8D85_00860 [bacterium]|nr:hypothetical protein [bacterium]